ncbi:MAG: hypothetical protein M1840_005149 [Geoglossum simile]|nr:MAG: hypothetical protein M1840_005149 [Geoglossum simile]
MAKALLLDPEFMEKGGILGFWCEHRYAHTTYDANERFPFTFKGVDVAIYSTFRYFGLNVETRPIMDGIKYGESTGKEYMGKAFHPCHLSWNLDEDGISPCYRGWRSKIVKGIVWMNTSKNWELAWVNPSYGNEPTMDSYYSSAAIVIKFPDFATRNQKGTIDQQI